MNKYLQLVDAVNDAKTQIEHDEADTFLNGWIAGVEHCGHRVMHMEADHHTMARFGEDRPMCCGVLLDWRPV